MSFLVFLDRIYYLSMLTLECCGFEALLSIANV